MFVEARPRVTVAVTQRESYHHTLRSLDSLFASTRAPFNLVYVDSGSPILTKRLLQREAKSRGFRLIRHEKFLTPNQSRNLALAAVETEFVAFVDNDVLFREAWLERLVECADSTGASIVGPLVCIGDPPFRKVHIAGGTAHVDETPAGRHFREVHRFVDEPLADVYAKLERQEVEMVEFHCMLARRALFEETGPLDEQLRSASEHMDLCMLARGAGHKVYFEPAATVNQLLPPPFPRDMQSLPFFLNRWGPEKNTASVRHFREKWNISSNDPALAATSEWLHSRRGLIFNSMLRPARKVRIIARRSLRRVLG